MGVAASERTRDGIAETQLLAGMPAGDPAAFAVLMRSNNQRLYRLARSFLRDDLEAEEVVHDSYVRAFTNLRGFRGGSSLATWLARIVTNEALGRLRRRRPTVNIGDMAETLGFFARAEPNPEQAIARREIRCAIEKAVDALPPPFRSVFMLRAIERMSIEETASYLDIPGETVKTRFHRANKLLRRALTTQFGAIFDDMYLFLGPRCDRLVATVLQRIGLAAEPPPRCRNAIGRHRAVARHSARRSPDHNTETPMRRAVAASGILMLASLPAAAQNVEKAPPRGDYKKVSELVKLPDFLPGLGTLYVKPNTLPEGPFLAYDHAGKLVSTIYMIPLKDLDAQKSFADLAAPGGKVDHVSIYYNAGHPGVQEAHYHVVLWHVSKAQEQLVAK